MTDPIPGIQPSVLRWARESAGLTREEVAEKLKRPVADILEWESGDATPSYPQLERLAYTVYKRPLAVFFLPTPPKESTPSAEFRTLPVEEIESLSADTRYHVRLAKALQLSLIELNDGKNPVADPIFRTAQVTLQTPVGSAAAAIRTRLGFTLDDQRACRTVDAALKAWRRAVEQAGVYVFKSSFKQKRISGFCLQDNEFPIIYLNNSTTKTRQVFSLLHELAHVLLRMNNISTIDETSFGDYSEEQKRIEIFCNNLAGEVLLPSSAFDAELKATSATSDTWVSTMATRYRVSQEVVLRKLLDRKLITKEEYRSRAAILAKAAEKAGSGGNYYATNAAYLGEHYLRLVFSKHYKGQLTVDQVADYLGVKTGSVAGLETMVLSGGVD